MPFLITSAPEQTHALGRTLGQHAHPGAVVAVTGDLGTGKTVLARGVGEGLEVQTRVCSPSFVVVQEHLGGRLPFWHADLYRIADAAELEQIGLEDALEGEGVVLIEWAERFEEVLPQDRLELVIEDHAEGRLITLRATGPLHAQLAEVLGGS
jgi:tRNA threonylcarbamoyladenosine biosynthesis protein TsaE